MTIEVLSMEITGKHGMVRMTAADISEERMMYMERRDDGFEKELVYEWNTADRYQFLALRRWLMKQKATKGKATYGDALQAVVGTVTNSPSGRFRVWDY